MSSFAHPDPYHSLPEALPVRVGNLNLEWIKKEGRWQALRIPGLPFPLSAPAVQELYTLLQALHLTLTADPVLTSETVLLFSQLHVADRATLLSERGSVWQPRMGLGVYPDQPPPQTWTRKDFEVFPEAGQKMRPPINNVLRLANKPEVQQEVLSECLVTGGLMRYYTQDFKLFTKEAYQQLAPLLTASVFQGFLFYVPLLNTASLTNADDEMLDLWLPRATAYMAQCPMEDAVVIAFRGDLQTVIREYGRAEQSA